MTLCSPVVIVMSMSCHSKENLQFFRTAVFIWATYREKGIKQKSCTFGMHVNVSRADCHHGVGATIPNLHIAHSCWAQMLVYSNKAQYLLHSTRNKTFEFVTGTRPSLHGSLKPGCFELRPIFNCSVHTSKDDPCYWGKSDQEAIASFAWIVSLV